MFYVYRFIDKDLNVIYVGRTVDIKARMTQHFGSGGHLPQKCYDAVHRVDFLEFKTKNDMKIKELYYIGKYRPTYNTTDNHDVSFTMNELEDVWVTYSKDAIGKRLFGDADELKRMETFIEFLKAENDKLMESNRLKDIGAKAMREEISRLKEEVATLNSEGRVILNNVNAGEMKKGHFDSLYSYARAIRLMKREPRLFSIAEIDGALAFVLRKHGKEIHADVGFRENKVKTIIMKSPERKREWKYTDNVVESDFSALQPSCQVSHIEHWKLQWRHKPYKKGA